MRAISEPPHSPNTIPDPAIYRGVICNNNSAAPRCTFVEGLCKLVANAIGIRNGGFPIGWAEYSEGLGELSSACRGNIANPAPSDTNSTIVVIDGVILTQIEE